MFSSAGSWKEWINRMWYYSKAQGGGQRSQIHHWLKLQIVMLFYIILLFLMSPTENNVLSVGRNLQYLILANCCCLYLNTLKSSPPPASFYEDHLSTCETASTLSNNFVVIGGKLHDVQQPPPRHLWRCAQLLRWKITWWITAVLWWIKTTVVAYKPLFPVFLRCTV